MTAQAWARLVAFVSAREDATSLALCRILVGLTIVGHVGRFWLGGTATLALVHADHGGLGTHHGWLEHVGGATAAHVHAVCAVVLASALLVTLGLFTRPALVVLWLAYRLMSMLNVDARGAYDGLLIDTLVLLMLSGAGQALALDVRLFPRVRRRGALAARWPRMLLVGQLGLMYSASAIMKVSSGWVPGGDASALWYILHQPMWVRITGDWLPLWAVPVTQLATTLVWCWEFLGLGFVVSLFLREAPALSSRFGGLLQRALARLRFLELYLLFGVAMHLGIEVLMEVGAFTGASLALYVCAIHPAAWRRLVRIAAARS